MKTGIETIDRLFEDHFEIESHERLDDYWLEVVAKLGQTTLSFLFVGDDTNGWQLFIDDVLCDRDVYAEVNRENLYLRALIQLEAKGRTISGILSRLPA